MNTHTSWTFIVEVGFWHKCLQILHFHHSTHKPQAKAALHNELSVKSLKDRQNRGFLLLWANFLLWACQLIMFHILFWKLGANFRTPSSHFSNFERIHDLGRSMNMEPVVLNPRLAYASQLGPPVLVDKLKS